MALFALAVLIELSGNNVDLWWVKEHHTKEIEREGGGRGIGK